MAEVEGGRKDLPSRASIIKNLDLPKSTPECIIIPCNKTGRGFLRNCFVEEYLKGYITKDEFDTVIGNITVLVFKAYSEKRAIDNKQLSVKVIWIILASLLMVIVFFITSYEAAIRNSATLRIISVVLLIIAVCTVTTVSLAIIFAKMPNYPDENTIVK